MKNNIFSRLQSVIKHLKLNKNNSNTVETRHCLVSTSLLSSPFFSLSSPKAFTLIELIVVIAIIAILGVAGFSSFSDYSSSARDSVRLTDLTNISKGLEQFIQRNRIYPLPEGTNVLTGTINGTTVAYKGEVGDNISNAIGLNKTPKDPLTKVNYTYGTTADGKQYQIGTVMEDSSSIVYQSHQTNKFDMVDVAFASTSNNSYPARVMGNYNGYIKYSSGSSIYLSNIPSILFNTSSGTTYTGTIDLFNTGTTYFIVDNKYNLPYSIDNNKTNINNTDTNTLIQQITNSTSSTLTGVNITSTTTSTGVTNTFTGTLLSSFGGNIQLVKQLVLGGGSIINTSNGGTTTIIVSYNNCTSTTYSGYTIPTMSHLATQTVTKSVANGTGSIQATCNNGLLTYGVESISCATNYSLQGGVCTYDGDVYFSNVSLLLHGDGTNGASNNAFLDSSSNNFAVTTNGNVAQGSFSPFSGTGGSAYFDGSISSYMTTNPGNSASFTLGTGDFTIEFWMYTVSLPNIGGSTILMHFGNPAPSPMLYINGGGLTYGDSGGGRIFATDPSHNVWHHLAISRASGSTKMFLDGTQVGSTYADLNNYASYVNRPIIGGYDGTNYPYNGYISNFRIVKGTAIYTTNFTPSTTPLTSVSGTSLLLRMENAGIKDIAVKNNLQTIGTAQISTAQSKFGGGSIYFDGAGSYLTAPANSNYVFGSGDFTIEAWLYVLSGGGTTYKGIIGSNGVSSSDFMFQLQDLRERLSSQTAEILIANTGDEVSLNTWTHVAIVRQGTNLLIFKNGTLIKTGTDSTAWTIGGLEIGRVFGSNGCVYNGYIDDLRITKGVARYTSNFTPTTQAFPDF